MEKLIGVLSVVAIPFALLNMLGGIVSGIWLAILGDWGSIGYGILSLFVSGFALGLAMIPALLLIVPGGHFLENGPKFLGYVFALLSSTYTVALMTAWCGAVLWFFAQRATQDSAIPILIWSYGVALGPWQFMAQKETEGGGGEGAVAITVFAQIGYVVMILMALLGNVSLIDVLVVFAAIMAVCVLLQLALTVAMMQDQPKSAPPDGYA